MIQAKKLSLTMYLLVGALGVAALGRSEKAAFAGVFNLPHFVSPGEFAIGLEPEFNMTQGSGVGGNIRYTQGLTDLNYYSLFVGTGTGSRQARFGGALNLDLFPDVQSQPGIGLAIQGLLVRVSGVIGGEISAIPYVHKSFSSDQGIPFEPFVAIPVGLYLSQGTYQSMFTVAIGSLFQHSEHFTTVAEFGIGLSQARTYVSGGIVYYH